MSWQRLPAAAAAAFIAERRPLLLDVRDAAAYAQAHMPGAQHLDNQSAAQLLATTDPAQVLLVYCYHGHSSQSAAAWLSEKGFAEVYSLDGGFEHWRQLHAQAR